MCNDMLSGYTPKAGYMHASLARNPSFHDASFPLELHSTVDDMTLLSCPLVLPRSIFGKRIQYRILEYAPLLDSSNMTIQDWIKIAGDIERHYDAFDAFVVLHGTDTMSYTASALSFMLEGLGKSVILTGSQIPLSELRNDAMSNLLGSLTIAGHYVIPEVTIYFGNKLYRGNRTVKTNLSAFEAFESPNLKPLASIGINIEVDWHAIWRSPDVKPFRARKSMNPNVTCLRLFPGITKETVKAVLAPCVQGVVMETFGAGNAPDNRPDLLEAIKDAFDRGVVMVNISQCRTGVVSDIYATGKALSRAGVVPGLDMTTECALTKLSYLLARSDMSPSEVREAMQQCLAGELSKPCYHPMPSNEPSSALTHLYSQLMHSLAPPTRHQFDQLLSTHFFHLAASKNDVGSMERILRQSEAIHIDQLDHLDQTPLLVAVSKGAVDATAWLLRNGASIHIRDSRGKSPLQLAMHTRAFIPGVANAGVDRIIRLLQDAGAKLTMEHHQDFDTTSTNSG